MTQTHRMDAAEACERISRIKLGETDFAGVLRIVADLAKLTVPRTDEVSVTLIRERRPQTAVFTAEPALTLDRAQYAHGHGPGLEAAATLTTLVTPRPDSESRWPGWNASTRASGVLSTLAVGLPMTEGVTAALNLYATTPHAFDADAVRTAEIFARHAAAALANAHGYHVQVTLTGQLQAAMSSRAVIEQAKGIIMGDRRCNADEAFQILTDVSQQGNRKVRDVATALVARAGRAR